MNRREHHVRPELFSVLANPPAFVLYTALSSRRFHFRLWPACIRVLWREEARKVSPDHVRCAVSQQSIRTFVPAAHATLRIQRENCVVLDRLDKQAESLLFLPQSCFSRQSFG